MTADGLHQRPGTDPIRECLRSFDRIAQRGMLSRVAQAVRQWRYRDWSRVPIHSVCILMIAPHGGRQRRPAARRFEVEDLARYWLCVPLTWEHWSGVLAVCQNSGCCLESLSSLLCSFL
jgi:hypothetical protein